MAKGILPAIRDFFLGTPKKELRARYDIAKTTPDNAKQWEDADNSDSDRANSPGVRQLARNRSRHETDNNPSLKGIVRTITHYEIGTGPTLHVEAADDAYAQEVEQRWREWCEATNLPAKLRQMVYGRVVDGEAFARLGFNPQLENEVKVDFQPFECDRCYTLWLPYLTPNRIDGVWFDTWGNPTYYDILQYHPGGVFPMPTWKFDTTPAQYVLHLFNAERANQHRGMPEMSTSTELFADRRRFRKATIGAAESAANVAGLLTTDQPADDGYAPSEYSTVAFPRNSLVVAPNQYQLKQVDPAHPAQTYEMFAAETLNEAARPVSMALNVAKCDSSRYNFAGGRLDIITSWKAVEVNQSNNTHRVVNRVFKAWYAEARLVYRWQAKDAGQVPAHQFFWVGMPYSDPEAEQNADEAAIKTGLKGIQEVYARRGKDWKVQQRLNAQALGMTPPQYLQFLLGNLETNKGGGEQGANQATSARTPSPADTPEQTAAKFRAQFPGLAARLNGRLEKALAGNGRRLQANDPDPENGGRFGKGTGATPDAGSDKQREREAKQRRTPFGTHQDIKSLVHDVVHETKGTDDQQDRWVKYALIDRDEAQKLKTVTGKDFEGYTHLMDGAHINHALNRHGAQSTRLATDEIPIDPADFEEVPKIIATADDVRLLPPDEQHPKGAIQYTKRVNGWCYVLEEVRKKHRTLALLSLFRMKTDPAKKQK